MLHSTNQRQPRMLVVIASYGDKNLPYLKNILQTYRRMSAETNLIVVSNAPKKLDPDVKVVVGLPSSNPWSLPFAHKQIFADNADAYDLFVYSEDDMAVTENHIEAFVRVTPHLEANEVAGYLRYEIHPSGAWSLPEMHGRHHWKPDSVRRRGSHTFAEFTNEHAGFYILTQQQLKRALASGKYLREPYEGAYGLPETAATDAYTCGDLRKVICISAVEDFLIHHLPNRYAGQLGLPLPSAKQQIETLAAIGDARHPCSQLCSIETKLLHGQWSKRYDEEPLREVLESVPRAAKSILSIGCGLGATEFQLKERGASVTALPLDSVVGAAVADRGIEVIYGNLEEAFAALQDRQFDCVLMTNLLHLLPDPKRVLNQCARATASGGTFVVCGPNCNSLPVRLKRTVGRQELRKLRSFPESGVQTLSPSQAATHLKRAGLSAPQIQWFNQRRSPNGSKLRRILNRITVDSWLIRARR
ncbi:MAG: class I SAM-dependent methyltransferase [Verrucomicrobiota bacterium]